jgi:hypothetical protein
VNSCDAGLLAVRCRLLSNLLLLLALTLTPSSVFGDTLVGRHAYPADCCAYELTGGGVRSIDLPAVTRNESARTYTDGATLVTRNGQEAAHCRGDTIAVWSVDDRNFTRRFDDDDDRTSESHGPISVRNGNAVYIDALDDETLASLDSRLIRLDLDCSIEGAADGRGTECALLWLGGEVDPRALQAPPCLRTGPAPTTDEQVPSTTEPVNSNGGAITTTTEGDARVQPVVVSAAMRPEVSVFGVVMGMLLVCVAMQIMLLIDAVEHRALDLSI